MAKITKEKLIKRAEKLYKTKKLEKCLQASNKILKSYPDELKIYMLKIDVLRHLEKYDEIEKTVAEFLSNSPKEESHYVVATHIFDEVDNHDALMNVLEEGIKLYPESEGLILLKAKRLYLSDMEEGMKFFEYTDKIPKTSPLWKELMYIKARAYKMYEEHEKSLEVYDEILKSSMDLETLSRKLKTLKMLEKEDEALEILDKMIAEDNGKDWALINKGIYLEGIDNKKAIELIDEVIENDPENDILFLAYLSKAYALFDNMAYQDAADYISKLTSLDKDCFKKSDFLFFLGKFAYLGNDPEYAKDMLKQIDFFDYIYDEAMEILMEINAPSIEEILGEKGLNILNKSPRDSELFDELIESGAEIEFFDDMPEERELKSLEDYEEAVNDFQKDRGKEYFEEHKGDFWRMLETRPYMEWLFSVAEGYWHEGRKEESIDKLKYMLELNPGDNQGARYFLWNRLLELNRLDEFEEYCEMFEEEDSPFRAYSLLLSAIKRNDDEETIADLYEEALETNKYVPDYLTGKSRLPLKPPAFYSPYDEDEAMYYSIFALKAWNDDKIAMKKLKQLSK